MPVINDAVVVNQAYQTSASVRPQRLDNGWLVSVVSVLISGENYKYNFYKSENNGDTWSLLLSYDDPTGSFNKKYFSLGSKGTRLYLIYANSTSFIKLLSFDATNPTSTVITTLDSGNSDVKGGNDLIIDRTKIYASWSNKNSALPNSFNIRFAEGTILQDGSVSWGAVEQVTTANGNGDEFINASVIVYKDNEPIILAEKKASLYANFNVVALKRTGLGTSGRIGSYSMNWTFTKLLNDSAYTQSSPQAIFVPQSINGLANGRIWVAWHGDEVFKIRVSFSDDGGVTWSPMVIISANPSNVINNFPTITANRRNEVHVIWWESYGATDRRIKKIKNVAGVWGTISEITGVKEYPSALGLDTSIDFTEPLFIYKDSTKVGFYGSWTVTNSSVPTGSIGQKTDKSNILSYSITTDGTMSTITEKINGVTVGTKTATSGQSLSVLLTQAQWDAIKYGKYATAAGALNTLTIEMGTEKWTYTFDKQLAANADLLSQVKAVKDAAEVYTPATKALLVGTVRSKGGTVSDGSSWETINTAVGEIELGKKVLRGSITASSGLVTVQDYVSNNVNVSFIAFNMRNLPFIPDVIEFTRTDKTQYILGAVWHKKNYLVNGGQYANSSIHNMAYRIPYVNGVVNIPVYWGDMSYDWVAYEE